MRLFGNMLWHHRCHVASLVGEDLVFLIRNPAVGRPARGTGSLPGARFSLADSAEERGTLSLDDADNSAAATGRAELAFSGVNLVSVLVAAGFVQCISVGSVPKSRAFVANGFVEDCRNSFRQTLDLLA